MDKDDKFCSNWRVWGFNDRYIKEMMSLRDLVDEKIKELKRQIKIEECRK